MGSINGNLKSKFKRRRKIAFITFTIVVFLSALFLGNRLTAIGYLPLTTDNNLQATFKSMTKSTENYDELFKIREQLYKFYDGEIDEEKLIEGAIKGMTAALNDPYTYYMNKEEFEAFNEHNSGEYMGVGIQVSAKENKIVITDPIEGGPADKAGIESGDILLKVNGADVSGGDLKKATDMMKGKKKEKVKLTLAREGKGIFDVDVTRDVVKLINIKGEMIDKEIGYIQVIAFEKNVAKDFETKLTELKQSGMKKLILDLRGNPGGYMNECVDIVSNFIPKGKVIVSTKDKYGKEEKSVSKGGETIGIPLAVLVNGNSASASEIVAGAIRDYKVGTLIGETTFGKGIVQTVLNEENGKGLKLTISKYYTPSGENIHKKGVKPDVKVEFKEDLSRKDYDRGSDPQFKKAMDILKEK